jgi:hypothetical protein
MRLSETTRTIVLAASGISLSAPCLADDFRWVTDPATGCALASRSQSPTIAVKWTGPCVDGRAEGRGTAAWSRDGKPSSFFDGEMKGGVPDGRATMTFLQMSDKCYGPNADLCFYQYSGDFQNGTFHGEGRMEYQNGLIEVGRWEAGSQAGVNDNIDQLTGLARNLPRVRRAPGGCRIGAPSDHARLEAFRGRCVDGVAHGPGKVSWTVDGKPYLDYEGNFENGWPHGNGKETVHDRAGCTKCVKTYDGGFVAGKRQGQAMVVYADGDKYVGEFRDGNRVGPTKNMVAQQQAEAERARKEQQAKMALDVGDYACS